MGCRKFTSRLKAGKARFRVLKFKNSSARSYASRPKKRDIAISKFSKDAKRYAANAQSHTVVLIGHERLTELMIKYKLGVQVWQNIEICDTRGDFFGDEI